jgi:glutaredoxin-related protein
MTSKEMYEALDSAGVDYEVVEIFEGVRIVRIFVEELTEGELK